MPLSTRTVMLRFSTYLPLPPSCSWAAQGACCPKFGCTAADLTLPNPPTWKKNSKEITNVTVKMVPMMVNATF